MRVLFSILILFQTIMPTICQAGVYEHSCSDDCQEVGGCEHESDCPDDPCSQVSKVIGVKEELTQSQIKPLLVYIQTVSTLLSHPDFISKLETTLSFSGPPPLAGRTYASKSLPLLI